MGNPKFIYQVVLHWGGPPCAPEYMWGDVLQEVFFTDTPLYSGDDDKEFVLEAVRELLEDAPLFQFLKPDSYISVSAAGTLAFSGGHDFYIDDASMDVEIEWHHFNVLGDESKARVIEEEKLAGMSEDEQTAYFAAQEPAVKLTVAERSIDALDERLDDPIAEWDRIFGKK